MQTNKQGSRPWSRGNTRVSRRAPNNNKQPLVVREDDEDEVRNPDAGLRRNLLRPLPFIVTPARFRKLRFLVTQTITSETISFQELLRMMTFSTSLNTGYSLLDCIRLRYVEIWEPYQGTAVITGTAGIVWEGSGGTNTGINRSIFGVSPAPDMPSHIYAKTPSDTLIGFWHQKSSASNAFTLNFCEAGSVIDIAFDYIIGDNDTTVGIGPYTIVAASAGITGIHPPSTSLVAVGLNNV